MSAALGQTTFLDRAIAAISPAWGAQRARYRSALAYYDAVRTSRLRRERRKDGTADQVVAPSALSLRSQARYLERNHDISRGVLNRMVQNIVGANGIGIEPQPRNRKGEILDDFAREILTVWRDWERRPEVTWDHDWASTQRLLCRAWLRDGEGLGQGILGSVPGLEHGSGVPYSIELLEADLLPLDYCDDSRGIVQGVQRNSWGRATAYWFHKHNPSTLHSLTAISDLKRIPADRVLHVKLVDRVGQARGISIFASVITRLDDVKDYEESERVAAKVAASMAAFIKKGVPDDYKYEDSLDDQGNPSPRHMKFRAGMIFDDLRPGEEIGTIDTKRPNPNTESFRNGQLRAAAAGLDVSYSSLARDYNGTYSAQRQELVEQWKAYEVLSDEFGSRIVVPVYLNVLAAALAAGKLQLPADLDPRTLDDVALMPPQMPWIDPLKEVLAWRELEEAGYASGMEITRRRGVNPRDVIEQEAAWRRMRKDKGLEETPVQPRRDPVDMRRLATID